MNKNNEKLVFLNIVGEDKPGIIASVTKLLFDFGCNLEDASMTLLDGKFAMMMVFEVLSKSRLLELASSLAVFEKKTKLSFFLREFSAAKRMNASKLATSNYIISAIGPDQTGIVYKISRILSVFKLNINDLNCKVLTASESSKCKLYSLALETYVGNPKVAAALKVKLRRLASSLKIEIALKPVETINF